MYIMFIIENKESCSIISFYFLIIYRKKFSTTLHTQFNYLT